MNNYKIVLDSGHGGSDSGATGNGIIEKDLTLKISQYIYNKLKELGIPVTMTRTTDETLDPKERVNRILNAYGNSDDVIVVSNHINAGGGDGAEVIYALRNDDTLANLVLNNLESAGQNPRKVYQRRLPSNPSKDYYFIHRNTGNTQPIIVEYGFLDSKGNDVNLLKNNYQQLAQATVDALLEYIGYSPEISENTYVVKSGDSLWSIAKKYNTTPQRLKELNKLNSNLLSVGQVLTVPELENEIIEDNVYIVKQGDTLYKVAQLYNINISDLINYNKLNSTTLSVGQRLLIPEVTNEIDDVYDIYTVKSGDTLYSISREFNTTPQELRVINNLGSNLLSIGEQIKVPRNENQEIQTEFVEYTVEPGDTLYNIAIKFDSNVKDIMEYNNLSSNLLSVGQIIRIPSSTLNNTYVVQSGDTLYNIALKFNTTVAQIKQKNNLVNNNLSVGQVLNV